MPGKHPVMLNAENSEGLVIYGYEHPGWYWFDVNTLELIGPFESEEACENDIHGEPLI